MIYKRVAAALNMAFVVRCDNACEFLCGIVACYSPAMLRGVPVLNGAFVKVKQVFDNLLLCDDKVYWLQWVITTKEQHNLQAAII